MKTVFSFPKGSLLFFFFLLISFSTPINAQVAVPRGLANELINDLKEQGYLQRAQTGYEFLIGFDKRAPKPCKDKTGILEHYGSRNNSLLHPQEFHYWISIKKRREILMLKRENGVTIVYATIKVLEQVDPYTYKVEEQYCLCPDCIEVSDNGNQVRINGRCYYDVQKGACIAENGLECRLVKQVKYYCGRLVFPKS